MVKWLYCWIIYLEKAIVELWIYKYKVARQNIYIKSYLCPERILVEIEGPFPREVKQLLFVHKIPETSSWFTIFRMTKNITKL